MKNLLRNKYSSRTLSLDKFNTLYKKKHQDTLDKDWLIWFIGFSEGDGHLGVNGNSGIFILTQKESLILYEIRDTLKFGYVKKYEGYSRLMVRKQGDIFLLFNLFNGNLHLENRILQLREWEKLWNSKEKNKDNRLIVITKPMKLSLNNSWLSGFTDAEGCFNVYVYKNKKVVRMRFILDQKDGYLLFNDLKNILGAGSVYMRKNNNFRYTL